MTIFQIDQYNRKEIILLFKWMFHKLNKIHPFKWLNNKRKDKSKVSLICDELITQIIYSVRVIIAINIIYSFISFRIIEFILFY